MYVVILLLVLVGLIAMCLMGAMWLLQYRVRRQVQGKMFCTFIQKNAERIDILVPCNGGELEYLDEGAPKKYYTDPKKSWNSYFPPGRMKILQANVRSALYAEGNPEPLDPFQETAIVTADLLGKVQDINFATIMVEQAKKEAEELENANVAEVPKLMVLAIFAICLASLVSLVILYMNMSEIGDLRDSIDLLIGTPSGT